MLFGAAQAMDVTSSSLVTQAATSAAQGPMAAQILTLRKALQLQQQGALALLQALPAPTSTPATGPQPLAREGTLGTRLNVMV